MERKDAELILEKACKTKKQKEAFELLFGKNKKRNEYKCNYYHEICSHCLNWPSPEEIFNDKADDCCTEHDIATYCSLSDEVSKTGKCKYFIDF